MRLPPALLLPLSTAAHALSQPPVPSITNITYWGSACPDNGLAFVLPPNSTNSSAPLAFTLSNFQPSLGSFGATLRMCNAVAFVSVQEGWKVVVNGKGTVARGEAELPAGARMYLRGTYAFAESAGTQSVGMFDTPGPLDGPFAQLLTPVEGSEKGVESGCAGGESELDIEFQARAVDDTFEAFEEVVGAVDASWMLTTDVEVVRC